MAKPKKKKGIAPKIDVNSPEFRKRFNGAQKIWLKKLEPLIAGARNSERITEKDLAVVITV